MVNSAFTVSRLSLYATAVPWPCRFPAERLGVSKVLGETQPGQLTLPKWMLMPYNGMLNSKSSGKGGQSREGHAYGILIPKQQLHVRCGQPWEVGKSRRSKTEIGLQFLLTPSHSWKTMNSSSMFTVYISHVNSRIIYYILIHPNFLAEFQLFIHPSQKAILWLWLS